MKHPAWTKAWKQRLGDRQVRQVARELAGDQARRELLHDAGYGENAAGLAARLAVELGRALSLVTTPAAVRSFARRFDQARALARAQAEARALPPDQAEPVRTPASRLRPEPARVREQWPWLSGQAAARLARGFLLSGDPDLLLAAGRALWRYARQNPPLLGLGWCRSDWLAARAINWLLALRMLGDLAVLDSRGILEVVLHLRLAAQVLARELEEQPPSPPPLPGQAGPAAALLFLGRGLAFLPEAAGWLELGRTRLGPALEAWSRPGQGASPATGEAAAACEFGGLGLWLARAGGLETPGAAEGLAGLARLCRALAPPWGAGGGWGHAPLGTVWGLELGREEPFTPATNLAALLLEDPELRAGRSLDEGLYWLLGSSAEESLGRLAGGGPPDSGDWPGAGLSLCGRVSSGRRVGIRLCSAPRDPAAGAEHQARALALNLFLEGKGVLVPPGEGFGGPLAPHLSSRAAHNALRLDRAEPGPGRVELEGLHSDQRHAFLAASYDGYTALPDPVRIRRRVFLDLEAGLVNLVDQVDGQDEHLVEIFFHLPPGSKALRTDSGEVLLEGGFGRVLLCPDPRAQVEIAQGRSNPPLGWRALPGGQVLPAPTVVVWAPVVGRAELANVLRLPRP